MQSGWYGPDDSWPTHPKSHWVDALTHARRHRWHLRYSTPGGHSFGYTQCSRVVDMPHGKPVFTSAVNSETHALDLIDKVDACTHPRDTLSSEQRQADVEAARQAGRLLDGAQKLMAAAGACLQREQMTDRADELLAMAELTVNDADALLDQAIELDADSEQVLIEAYAAAAAAGVHEAELVAPQPLGDQAEQHLDSADIVLGNAGSSAEVQTQRDRVPGLRGELAALRAHITEASPGQATASQD